jgi:hypothetical protein
MFFIVVSNNLVFYYNKGYFNINNYLTIVVFLMNLIICMKRRPSNQQMIAF